MSSAIETELSQLAIEKSDWTPAKFGDVAFEPKESVKDALKEGIEHVVGLEHIETGDIHLRRSNSIEESTTFSKKFSPGDVLFGRRRAYLKKAAQVEFAGICSGDIIVMRANAAQLLPELLPFVVNNEKFFDWAITHSAGGLSPRCKFKDLASYEFLLPPKAQQAEIAELLWAMDEALQKSRSLLERFRTFKACREKEVLLGCDLKECDRKDTVIGSLPIHWNVEELPKMAWFQEGPGLRKWQFQEEGIKVINVTNLVNGYLDLSLTDRYVSIDEFTNTYQHFECDSNDIVIASSGNSYGKHAIVRSQDLPLMMNTSVIRFKPIDGTDYDFLNQLLKSKLFKKQIDKLITGAAQPNFGPFHLKKVFFPKPDNVQTQRKIGRSLKELDDKEGEIILNIFNLFSVQKSLINQVF